MTDWIHPAWLRHDIRDVACFVMACSLLANFLPRCTWVDAKMRRFPILRGPVHDFYVWFVDMIAFCSLNFRAQLPSMDFQWFGFARLAKHSFRNWKQDRADRKVH